MAITVVGQGSAAATSVAIPAHQIGDLILVFARGTAAAPVKPAAAGTVPAWANIQSAVANSIGLTSVGFVATATNHTTGVFTSATHICVIVLRPGAGATIEIGTSSTGNANNTQTIVYPALTLTRTNGTSMGVRCGTRVTADSEVGTSLPSGWTNQTIQPAGASALMAVHIRAALVANPTADSVATTGTNAAYRAHTVEVEEIPAAVNHTVPISDGIALADTPGKTRGIGRVLADLALQADALAQERGYGRAPADMVALAEALARVRTVARTLADPVLLADAPARTRTVARTLSDLVTLADTGLFSEADAVTIIDSLLLTDLASPVWTPAPEGHTRSPADTLVLIDALGRAWTVARARADAVALADSCLPVRTVPSDFTRQIALTL